MSKKPILLLLIICILVSCSTISDKESDVISIGVNLPLSGKASYFGVEFKNGLLLAIDEYNDTCTRNSINLLISDNQYNARQAVSIAHKFINVDNVDIIIAGYTPIVKAVRDIVNSASVPMLASITSSGRINEGLDWIFRDFVLESESMPVLADYAYYIASYRFGTSMVINDDFGLDAKDYFETAFTDMGGTMSDGEVFEASEMDHRTKINKLLADNPEFVLVIGRGAAMINACRQIKETDPEIPILTTESMNMEYIWNGLGDAGEGIVFSEIAVNKESDEYRKINTRSEEIYGKELNWVSIYGYTIGKYLADIIYEKGSDREKIRNALKNLNVGSIRGHIIMNKDREVITPLIVKKRENGINVKL